LTVTQGIVGILLAAGIGRRFGSDKLMHRLPDGRPMALAAATSLLPACDRVIAVLRHDHGALADALSAAGCEILSCPEAEGGMGHSLAAGVSAAADAAGWIVALGDMPCIATHTHHAVATCLKTGASLVATDYRGQRGHPVGFSSVWFPELFRLTGDRGGRMILEANRQHLTIVSVDDPGAILDIDRPDDLPDIQCYPALCR
jgi:molybdenum cofactor cytidylyltransferase